MRHAFACKGASLQQKNTCDMNTEKDIYDAPQCEVLELSLEGVVAGSGGGNTTGDVKYDPWEDFYWND